MESWGKEGEATFTSQQEYTALTYVCCVVFKVTKAVLQKLHLQQLFSVMIVIYPMNQVGDWGLDGSLKWVFSSCIPKELYKRELTHSHRLKLYETSATLFYTKHWMLSNSLN